MEADLCRQVRLHEIKVELTRLAGLGGPRAQAKGEVADYARKPFLVKKAS